MNGEWEIRQKKILIIDDDPVLLEELEYALGTAGHSVVIADDAPSVEKIAAEIRPDLIVLDMKMDGRSGFQIADDLKHFPGTAQIPILGMTGYFTTRRHVSFMRRCGIGECIIKPFNPYDMIATIDRML